MTDTDVVTPSPAPVRPAAAPLSPAGASYLAVVLALVVIAIGAVGVREGVIATGWVDGSPWTPGVANWLAAQRPGAWMVPVGVVLAIAGLACAITALTPRRKRTAQVSATTAVFVDRTDVARIASASAESVPGVVAARSTSRRGAVVVRCDVTGASTTDQRHAIDAAVGSALDSLIATPRIVIRTRTAATR